MTITQDSLTEAKRTMCTDAFNLLELAYLLEQGNIEGLPLPETQTLDVSPLTVISLEGINCAGKSTLLRILRDLLKERKPLTPPRFYPCVSSEIISSGSKGYFYEMGNPVVDSLVIASAYVEKWARILSQHAQGRNGVVITDRSADSLYVFQGRKLAERGIIDLEEGIQWLMRLVDCVDRDAYRFYLDVPLSEACARSNSRRLKDGRDALNEIDVQELTGNLKVYDFLKKRVNRRYIHIDASLPVEGVTASIMKHLNGNLNGMGVL